MSEKQCVVGYEVKRSILVICFGFITVWCGLLSSCTTDQIAGPVVKTELSNTISGAIKIVINTSEGAAGGNYARGSRATLITAITNAQNIYADKAVTQVLLDAANQDLKTAVTVYQSKVIVEIDPANLVGQWTFDQVPFALVGTGVLDNSGQKHDGTLKAGHVLWGEGVPTVTLDRYGVDNKALHFDRGANVEIPFDVSINPAILTISLWVKSDVNTPIVDNQFMVSLDRKSGYQWTFPSSLMPTFTMNSAENPGNFLSGNNGTALPQGTWYHLAVTFGNGHMKFYVNGALTKDMAQSGTILQQPSPINLVFGQDLPTSSYSLIPSSPHYLLDGGYFIGAMDEIRIYKTVLTDAQISSIYSLEKP